MTNEPLFVLLLHLFLVVLLFHLLLVVLLLHLLLLLLLLFSLLLVLLLHLLLLHFLLRGRLGRLGSAARGDRCGVVGVPVVRRRLRHLHADQGHVTTHR